MHCRVARLIAASLLLSFGFSSCAYMTAQGRREMAFRHYLAKHMSQRQKQIAKAQKASNKAANRKLRRDLNNLPPVSEPIVHTSVEPADQAGAPITVSSDATQTSESEPSP